MNTLVLSALVLAQGEAILLEVPDEPGIERVTIDWAGRRHELEPLEPGDERLVQLNDVRGDFKERDLLWQLGIWESLRFRFSRSIPSNV